MKDARYPYALDIGSEIGGYRIEAVLGAGGFGITYRAVNDVTEKTVAIKEFYIRDISTRSGSTVVVDTEISAGTYEFALKKFQDEALTVVTRFQHPYIIRGENFIKQNNTSYLIMEYVDGLNFEEWLNDHPEPPNEAVIRAMFEKIFDAVDYVHSKNTMHRDLTPRNIMVRSNGEPVLIDFGAAGHGIDKGRSSRMVAQMRYAPPEQTDEEGSGVHGRYTDIFSLGGVLYRAATGRVPIAPMTRAARLGRRDSAGLDPHVPTAEAVLDRSQYSRRFMEGVDHALQLDERDRPQSIAEFRRALGWVEGAEAEPDFDDGPEIEDRTVVVRSGDEARFLSSDVRRQFLESGGSGTTPPSSGDTGRSAELRRSGDTGRSGDVGRSADRGHSRDLGRSGDLGRAPNYNQQADLVEGRAPSGGARGSQTGGAGGGRISALTGGAQTGGAHSGGPPLGGDPGHGIDVGHTGGSQQREDKRGGGAGAAIAKIAAALVVVAGLGAGGWYAAPQIRALIGSGSGGGTADAPVEVSPFVLTAAIDGGRVALSGHVPSEADRKAITEAIGRGGKTTGLDDRLALGKGAPAGFSERVQAVAARLGDLAKGRIVFTDGATTIEGTPTTPEAYAALVRDFAKPLAGGGVVSLALSPATAQAYAFTAEQIRGRTRLSGYLPDEASIAKVLQATRASMADREVETQVLVAAGGPDRVADQAAAIVPLVADLATGRITLSGKRWRIEGDARSADAFAHLASAVQRGLPGGAEVELAVQPPTVSPYEWSATWDGTKLAMRGHVPSPAAQRDLAAAAAQALPSAQIVDETTLAGGAGSDFPAVARTVIEQFAHLTRGRIAITDRAISVDGSARGSSDFAALTRAMTVLPGGYAVSRNNVDAPRISPYTLSLDLGASGVRVTGFVPSDEARAQVLATAKRLTQGRVVDETLNGSGAPDTFLAEVGFGADVAARLTSARVAIEDASVSISGRVKNLDDIGSIKEKAVKSLPSSVKLAALDISGRNDAPATECDILALPLLHRDRPPGLQGVPNIEIDPAKALKACTDAVATQPDVRRFATALGVLRIKRGELIEAAALLGKASVAGDPTAMAMLAGLYRDGLGVPMDQTLATTLAEDSAKQGDPRGMLALGIAFERGLGRPLDPAQAADWYDKAGRLGSSEARAALARLIEKGNGRPADPAKAYDLYLDAAKGGATIAMHQIATMMESGAPRGTDLEQALGWYAKAAAAGRVESMVALGGMILDGRGRPADPVAAAGWFEKAAALGSAAAMHQLGVIALDGRGRPADPRAAMQWFERAVALGEPASMGRLGFMLLGSHGTAHAVPADYGRASDLFLKGAKANDPTSAYGLGLINDLGLGRAADPARALDWYIKAGAAGLPQAMVRIGMQFEAGRGQPADPARAVEWYRRAAEAGSGAGADRLGQLALAGAPGRAPDEDEAERWFEKAARAGSALGAWNAAVLLDRKKAPNAAEDAARLLIQAYTAGEVAAVAALSGDMAAFTPATRRALLTEIKKSAGIAAGSSGEFDAAARKALQSMIAKAGS